MSEPGFTSSRPAVRWQTHLLLYGLLTLPLLYILIVRYLHPLVLSEPIAVESASVQQVQERIDPNTATWSELARLPGVGESLAKRIVAYRDDRVAHGTQTVFQQPRDLEAIKGIGPKILERMTPWLAFPQPASP